ncbi:hotdog fold domain-containing protein [Photobacterium sp. MCCC 1A19761]|uniref:hotdog fold domain-containing protein n=1 Tax=Photobacterium sp. MCCC 1A19761 TaxID=3115000 RepID=UPI00307F049E
MRKNLKTYQRLTKLPFGRQIFSWIVCRVAPYFSSIKPQIHELRPGFAEVTMKKRRRVTNHLNTVHAIAMCNMAELAAGMMTDVSVPVHSRWIPVGMTVAYLNKATTDLSATAIGHEINWETAGEKKVPVEVRDTKGTLVFQAEITMNVRLS